MYQSSKKETKSFTQMTQLTLDAVDRYSCNALKSFTVKIDWNDAMTSNSAMFILGVTASTITLKQHTLNFVQWFIQQRLLHKSE